MKPEIAHAGTTGTNERAVLRPDDRLVRGTTLGMNEPFEVAEGTRQTVLNIPVGVPALYLLNKADIIIGALIGRRTCVAADPGAVVEGPTTDDPSVTSRTPLRER